MSLTPLPEADRLTGGSRRAGPDAVCAAAVDLAREAAAEMAAPDPVGEHLGVTAEGERLVLHTFASTNRGYIGWRWAVSVARAPRSRTPTVCEVVLLPGDGAVLAPAWVPWVDRIAPGDLGAGDELPYRVDDPNLVPGYEAADAEDADRLELWELGLGRKRVLGPEGRGEAARRWYAGKHGPTADIAVQAVAHCASCGYFLPLAGSLRRVFGVCANEWSPSDGSVVSLDHGCGAHSETDVVLPEPEPLPDPILDENGIELVVVDRTVEPLAEVVVEPVAERVFAVDPDGLTGVIVTERTVVEPAPVVIGLEQGPVAEAVQAAVRPAGELRSVEVASIAVADGPASPDPASPDPVSPDPVSPDPASPDPAMPDPAEPAGFTEPGFHDRDPADLVAGFEQLPGVDVSTADEAAPGS